MQGHGAPCPYLKIRRILNTSGIELVRTGGPQVPAPHEMMNWVFPFLRYPQLFS